MFMHGSLPIGPEILGKYRDLIGSDKTASSAFWSEFFQYAMPFLDQNDNEEGSTPSVSSTVEWVDALNSFAKVQSDAWQRQIRSNELDQSSHRPEFSGSFLNPSGRESKIWSTLGGYHDRLSNCPGPDFYGALAQYGMGSLPGPSKEKNPSIIYSSWMDGGMPRYMSGKEENDLSAAYQQMMSEFFTMSSIDVILTGHQPVGDVPYMIQLPKKDCKETSKFIVSADTSYSGDTKWKDDGRKNLGRGTASESFRGDVAVTEVLLEECLDTGRVESIKCHGALSDGTVYQSVNFMNDSNICTDDETCSSEVGKLVDKNKFVFEGATDDPNATSDEVKWWVKSKFEDGNYLLCASKGFEVINAFAAKKPCE